jgi:hypothetical protein
VALLSLHPQFALVSTAVSPDVLVNLCGALLWWQAARALGGSGRYSAGIISAITALVALLTKRMGLPLVAMAAVVIVLAFAGHRRPRLEWKWYMVVAGVLLAAPVALLILTPDLSDAVRYGARLLGGRDPGVPPAHLSLGRFSSGLLQSAWLNAGWLTVPAPPGWYLVASCVSAVALIAVTGLFTPESWQWPKLATGVAVAFVAIQTAAIYGTYYRADLGAQGRYLLPIAGPFFALVWAGGTRYWPRRYAGAPAVVLFATMVLLDVCSWTRVLVPGFSR